jgi:UrcA family protein
MILNQARFNSRNLVLSSLIALAIGSASFEAAAADGAAPSVKVSYADLDLSRPAGAQMLYRRLKHAAASVCGPSVKPAELDRYAAWKSCYEPALHNAVMQVGAPGVFARYEDDSGTHAGS